MKKFILIISAITLLLNSAYSMLIKDFFNDAFFFKVKTTYGKQAVKRAHRWHEVIEDSRDENEWKKLNKINYFFNQQISYQNDLDLWGKNDYWASPLETIGRGLGDCEDFAIAKFFSLTALGIPEKKLRLMYVRQLTVNEPHMVLIYFKTPKSIPLVLDNYHPKILAANKRPDLKPIYSFNGNGLWMSKAKGLGRKIREGSGVSNWDRLIEKIELEQGQTERNG